MIPGVPAGLGAASYAGVPLTYPGGGDTLTFVRGHEDEGKRRAAVDWTSLSRLDGTVVCYAGSDQLAHMLSALLAHGHRRTIGRAFTTAPAYPGRRRYARGERRCEAVSDRRAAFSPGRVAALRGPRWFIASAVRQEPLVTRPSNQAAELWSRSRPWVEAIEPAIRIMRRKLRTARRGGAASPIRLGHFSAQRVEAFSTRLLASPRLGRFVASSSEP